MERTHCDTFFCLARERDACTGYRGSLHQHSISLRLVETLTWQFHPEPSSPSHLPPKYVWRTTASPPPPPAALAALAAAAHVLPWTTPASRIPSGSAATARVLCSAAADDRTATDGWTAAARLLPAIAAAPAAPSPPSPSASILSDRGDNQASQRLKLIILMQNVVETGSLMSVNRCPVVYTCR